MRSMTPLTFVIFWSAFKVTTPYGSRDSGHYFDSYGFVPSGYPVVEKNAGTPDFKHVSLASNASVCLASRAAVALKFDVRGICVCCVLTGKPARVGLKRAS